MMRTSEVFERLVLESARTLAPACTYGRKRALEDKDALAHIFSILRTGMQWRELRGGGAGGGGCRSILDSDPHTYTGVCS